MASGQVLASAISIEGDSTDARGRFADNGTRAKGFTEKKGIKFDSGKE
jgi:hypothetical protein